jgi:predicted nucleic acid-binding protein
MTRLYVESNFVLEVVLDQEDRAVCDRLLSAAAAGDVELVLPSFCIAEPLETLGRRHKNRQQLHQGLQAELNQLRRSQAYARELTEVDDVVFPLLVKSREEDVGRLETLYLHVANTCSLAPLNANVVRSAFELGREFDLDPPDAFVLASVLAHTESEPASAAFVTKNTKDFDDPELRQLLERHGCRLLTGFGEALGYVLGEIRQ